jgi:hypothetical protein
MKRRGFLQGLFAAAAYVAAPPVALAKKVRNYWQGTIGHTVVYDRALTDEELEAMHKWMDKQLKEGGRAIYVCVEDDRDVPL